MKKRFKYTTYLAGSMEFSTTEDMTGWRDEITEKLKHPDLMIYNPVVQESEKGGLEVTEQIERIKNLKRAGQWDIFFNEMWRIWFGTISQNTDLIQLLGNLRMRKYVDGNYAEKIQYWGDSEAVVRSDFIVAHVPKESKMVGTIIEVTFAFLFRIPIYLILPDDKNTNANSTLLFASQISNNGQVKSFYTIDDCVKQIREDFKF